MSTDNPYELGTAAKTVLRAWWAALQSETASGQARADRATLRRAADLNAVACTPAYQRLYRRMVAARGGTDWPSFQQDRLAAVVGLLSHINTNTEASLPQAMCSDSGQENPVSALRFQRLLESPDVDALFSGLRRSLPLIKGGVSVLSLADDVFGWGPRIQRCWAYDYRWPEKSSA